MSFLPSYNHQSHRKEFCHSDPELVEGEESPHYVHSAILCTIRETSLKMTKEFR
jgi:hypothetical protein